MPTYKDVETRVRSTTQTAKENMIAKHILPFFENMKMSEISKGDIRRWQNTMLEKTNPQNGRQYSQTYLRSVNSQLSAIFNFAVEFYGLNSNPCLGVKAIGKKQATEMLFWTLDEFNKAIDCERNTAYHLCFMLLYWTGIRVGECLALTPSKILHQEKALDINASYHRIDGQDMFGPTKTDNSIRKVPLPDFVYDELTSYVSKVYGIEDDDRIFYFTKSALNKEITRISQLGGVKRIRVHDLRHSHTALLIELGYGTHAIADRLGDTPEVVDRTYAHLYPSTAKSIADELSKHKSGLSSDLLPPL